MKILGLILAGGRATRMGGADKGLKRFAGEPLALRAWKRLAPQADGVFLSANRSFDEYRTVMPPEVPILKDLREGFPGPLAGLEAALVSVPEAKRSETWVATVPCDCPFFPKDLIARLRAAAEAAGKPALASAGGNLQPSFMLIRADALPSLQAFLDADGHRLRAWLLSLGAVPVEWGNARAFLNCNTIEELEAAQSPA